MSRHFSICQLAKLVGVHKIKRNEIPSFSFKSIFNVNANIRLIYSLFYAMIGVDRAGRIRRRKKLPHEMCLTCVYVDIKMMNFLQTISIKQLVQFTEANQGANDSHENKLNKKIERQPCTFHWTKKNRIFFRVHDSLPPQTCIVQLSRVDVCDVNVEIVWFTEISDNNMMHTRFTLEIFFSVCFWKFIKFISTMNFNGISDYFNGNSDE